MTPVEVGACDRTAGERGHGLRAQPVEHHGHVSRGRLPGDGRKRPGKRAQDECEQHRQIADGDVRAHRALPLCPDEEPLPLREGIHRQGTLTYRLERLDAATWRVHHHPGGSVASYDLRTQPRELADFADRCQELATSSTSAFVRVFVAQHHREGQELALRSRIFRTGGDERILATLDEFVDALRTLRIPVVDLGTDGVEALWARTETQLAAWLELQASAAH